MGWTGIPSANLSFLEMTSNKLYLTELLGLDATGEIYLGAATTDGTWKIVRSTTGLDFQKRVGGSYVSKLLVDETITEIETTNTVITDKLITLNKNGAAASGGGTGFEVEEAGSISGYLKVSSDRNSWELKAPNTAGVLTITPGTGTLTIDQSSHDPVTIDATPNGLGVTGQVVSLALASTSTIGALSDTDWNTFNGKQDALTLGDLTESTSSILTITGGTGAIIGSGLSIQVSQATTTTAGYLSSTDWNTFNGKENVITFSTGLNRATNTVTALLSVGVSGGQSVIGGSGASENLTLSSTSNATKGSILFGTSSYNEATNVLTLSSDIILADASNIYFGASGSDNSWRIVRSGNNLVIERRESGSWVTKSTILA